MVIQKGNIVQIIINYRYIGIISLDKFAFECRKDFTENNHFSFIRRREWKKANAKANRNQIDSPSIKGIDEGD
ncbi:MAG TPA: hypothetical protein VMV49_01930 [Candidatus Deferrimicrobium sp.]|nr:hypothetical protein [Candidatus Deferrimicrobium sp.]